jgi:hypothetical protein
MKLTCFRVFALAALSFIAHPSREAAAKNWAAFRGDPEWQKVAKELEADGKIVEKVDSTYMDPTDFSKIK